MMNPIFSRTRVRLTLASALAFALVAVVAASGVWILLSQSEYSAVDASLQAQADSVRSGLDVQNGRVTFQGSDTLPGETTSGIAVTAAIVTSSGRVLDASGTAIPGSSYVDLIAPTLSSGPQIVTTSIGGVSERLATQSVDIGGGQRGVLVVARPITEVQRTLDRVALLLAAAVAILAIVGTALGYWLAGRALRPVRMMSATARNISEQDLHRRITAALPPDEIGELADTFNAMLARLEASFGALRRFTADAAHELRAPLALLRAEAEVALARPRNADDDGAALQTMLDEVLRLSNLAEQLLLLARADGGVLTPRMDSLDLCTLVSEAESRWSTLATTRQIAIETDCASPATIKGDPDLLRRVIDNVMDNAMRYTQLDGSIRLVVENGDCVALTVSDSGPGVAGELREAIFDRFTREDKARQRDSGGAGLGLSLCRAIMEAHGGTISLGDRPGQGGQFTLVFPSR